MRGIPGSNNGYAMMNWSETERTFRLADSFDAADSRSKPNQCQSIDLSAPLPLGYGEAIRRAVQLRASNPSRWTYNIISEVMAAYHGWTRSAQWWRDHLIAAGVPRAPRGNAHENFRRNGNA